jgi:mannosyltransferase OCH1-like enzyme
LMSRPFPAIRRHIPKLFHQSWSSRELPAKFRNWSKSCREMHADWEWVLWTDEDNDRLFRNFFPRLVSKYESLPGPIYRADMARYAYMFLFGGYVACLLKSLKRRC